MCLCEANEMIVVAALRGLELAHQLIWLPFRSPILKMYLQQDDKCEVGCYVLQLKIIKLRKVAAITAFRVKIMAIWKQCDSVVEVQC